MEVQYQNQKREFDPTTITAMILGQIKRIAEKATEKPCKDVVIAVRLYFMFENVCDLIIFSDSGLVDCRPTSGPPRRQQSRRS